MNWVDAVIVVAVLIPTLMGLKIGIIKMVVPLAGTFLGVLLAVVLHGYLADALDCIESESWAHIAAFAIIFVIVFALVYILAIILRKILQAAFLGWVDRLAGAVLVFITVWLLCSFVVAMVAKYGALGADYVFEIGGPVNSESIERRIDESALATFQVDTFPVIIGLLPDEFDVVKKYF